MAEAQLSDQDTSSVPPMDEGENSLEQFSSPAVHQNNTQVSQGQPAVQTEPEEKKLPTWDEAAEAEETPTWEQAAAKEDRKTNAGTAFVNRFNPFHGNPFTEEGHQEMTDAQRIWAQKQPMWNIVKAFGHGFAETMETEAPLEKDTLDTLKKYGAYKNYMDFEDISNKSIMDGTIIPAAKTLYSAFKYDMATTAATGLQIGKSLLTAGMDAPVVGFQEAAEQFGTEIGHPEVGQAIAALPEAALAVEAAGMGIPHPPLPPIIARGKAAGALESEAVFTGVKEPTPEQAQDMHEAAQMYPEAYHDYHAEGETPPLTPKTIHDVARSMDPVTFDAYDRASARLETYKRWYNDATEKHRQELESSAPPVPDIGEVRAQAPHAEEIADLEDKLENDAGNARQKARKQEALERLRTERDNFIESEMERRRTAHEDYMTDGMANKTPERQYYSNLIAKEFQDKFALSHRVESLYRKAERKTPKEPEAPEEKSPWEMHAEGQESAGAEQIPAEAVAKASSEEKIPSSLSLKSPEEQRQSIIDDVRKSLVAAGRPQEEADAAAQLVAAHYQARSERFSGKLGTAAEMYERDAAKIKAGREKADQGKELAQKAKGKIRLAVDGAKAVITLFKSADASTFIHETGHHWLDELMRDSTHEAAPAELRAHAEAVKKWLGVKEGEEITTRQHEKFARGFERYMMEGVAPSRALEGVFVKFKKWLTDIYQTVQKLRSPITDEVRGIFDRLLANVPEKAVIAPEREPGKALADIHEADEKTTPVEKMPPVRDNVEQEVNLSAGQHKPEAKDALRAREETGKFTPPTQGAAGPGGEAQSAPRGPGAVQESPEIPVGGGADGGEDRGAREDLATKKSAANESGSRRSSGKSERPESPDTVLGEPESDLVDKAGNIRLDNLNTPEDINEVLRQTAEENDDFMGARGIVSDAQVDDLASALGIKASEVSIRKIAKAFGRGQLASKIVAGRKLLIQSATSLRDAMAKAATGSDEDVLAYAEAKARHIMIQESLSAVTAEAGRALRAFRKLEDVEGGEEAQSLGEFLKTATGKDLFQLKKEAQLGASLDTPQKVSKFIQDSKKMSFGDMILEYWVNGLISGPATHTTYMVGNTISALWKATFETGAASVIGKAYEAFGREGGGIRAGEIGAQLKGAVGELPNALSAAGKAIKTGVTTLLPGEEITTRSPLQQQGMALAARIGNAPKSWQELGSDIFGTMKGLRDAFIATGQLIKSGGIEGAPFIETRTSPIGAIPDVAIKGIQIPVGSVIRTPARAIAAIHSFFRTANYSMDKAGLAYRAAAKEGLSGTAFDARVADLVTNPSEDLMKQARGTATDLTLMGTGGHLTQAISRLTNVSVDLPGLGPTKLLKFVDPFVHIGSNVIEQAVLRRTPVGLLSSELRADLSGANGAAVRDMAQARMLVGTALAVTVGGLAAEGLVSGSGPSDTRQNAAWRMLGGNQPHSVKIGDMWYDVHRLGPLGMLVGISADMYDVAHAMGKEDAAKVASMLVHSITQNILDESFMRGPSELIKAVSDSDRYGDEYIRNFVSSFVPFSVGLSQVARAVDPYSRQTRTTMDAIKAKIPWESESLLPRRDVWGEPVANKDVLGPEGFSSIYETQVNHDPVNQALLRIGVFPSHPQRKIRGVELTDDQYDDYTRIAGRLSKSRLNNLVAQPGFSAVPQGQQIQVIKKIMESSRETARKAIMMKNPDIVRQAVEKKLKIAKQ